MLIQIVVGRFCKELRIYNNHKIKMVVEISSNDHFRAQDWIRTSTSLRTLRPEHSASTNFATWATQHLSMFRGANIGNLPFLKN